MFRTRGRLNPKRWTRALSDRVRGTAFERIVRDGAQGNRHRFVFAWNRGLGDIALGLVPLFLRIRATDPLARIEVVVRRRRSLEAIQLGDLTLDLSARRVQRGERVIDLSPREFDVLMALARAHGRVLSRAELLERVWGITFEPGTNVVEVHVARLRSKLHAGRAPILHTKRGEGYYLSDTEEPA